MKKYLTIMAALALSGSTLAQGSDTTTQLRFSELPYTDGKLFVSVTCCDTTLLAKAMEIEDDNLSIPTDLSVYYGKELNVRAFQDLNGNDVLDFDGYGRPTEPCLQTVVTPDVNMPVIDLKLVQY